MEVNWHRIFMSLLIYGATTALGLIVIAFATSMYPPSKPNGSHILPFMVFMFSTLNTLRGDREDRSSAATQVIGVLLIVVLSMSSFPLSEIAPAMFSIPYGGPLGSIVAIAILLPGMWFVEAVRPSERD